MDELLRQLILTWGPEAPRTIAVGISVYILAHWVIKLANWHIGLCYLLNKRGVSLAELIEAGALDDPARPVRWGV